MERTFKDPGLIVQWTKDGILYTGVAFNRKQHSGLLGRLLINRTNEDGSFVTDENGKNVVALKARALVKVIGFID